MAQGVHGEMHLGALAPLVPVVTRSFAALHTLPWKGAGIEHGGGGLLASAGRQAQEHPQVMGDLLEDPGPQPALALLVD